MYYDIEIYEGCALIVVDYQKGFILPKLGELPIDGAEKILNEINSAIDEFRYNDLPVIFTKDWHPKTHVSFRENGGKWNTHCVADTEGAELFDKVDFVQGTDYVILKGQEENKEEYSGFESLDSDGVSSLYKLLTEFDIDYVFVCGLATDYCVLKTVLGALDYGFDVILLKDAIKAVDYPKGSELEAIGKMVKAGAQVI